MGSTHDSTAFSLTKLAKVLQDPDHLLARSDYWIAGDDAYKGNANSMHGSLLTPYPGKKIGEWKDAYNFFQSSCRISIECTFGEVVVMSWDENPTMSALHHTVRPVRCTLPCTW